MATRAARPRQSGTPDARADSALQLEDLLEGFPLEWEGQRPRRLERRLTRDTREPAGCAVPALFLRSPGLLHGNRVKSGLRLRLPLDGPPHENALRILPKRCQLPPVHPPNVIGDRHPTPPPDNLNET